MSHSITPPPGPARCLRCRQRVATVLAICWLAAAGAAAAEFDVVISEIHYHPPLEPGGQENLEFIELQNLSDEMVNLEGWTLDEGISFVFPPGAAVPPLGFAVVARNKARIEAAYGLEGVIGDYSGSLGNGRDRVALRNRAGELIDRIGYRDEDSWPGSPDGLGPSLEKIDAALGGEDAASWRASIFLGGTPGARNSTAFRRVTSELIIAGDLWKYRKGTQEPSQPVGSWAAPGFNDAPWSSGPSGFGYGDNDDATVLSDMRNLYTTVYLRGKFSIPSPDDLESLPLTIVYDDAYVLYLNGAEAARSASAGGTPETPLAFNASSAGSHNFNQGNDTIDLAGFKSLLQAGTNVIGIQVLNADIGSSDLSMIPTLSSSSREGAGPPEPSRDFLINEVFAGGPTREGYIEIYNQGPQAADLAGLRLVDSPVGSAGYTVPSPSSIPSKGRLVINASALPFPLTEAGQWIGLITSDSRFVDGVEARKRPAAMSWGRVPDGSGDTFVLELMTPGTANVASLESRVAINEIRYHPPLGQEAEEFVEIHNRAGQAIDIGGWRLDKGASFTFPLNASIPGSGFLVISGNPAAVAARYGIAGVLGPWTGGLSNGAEKLELRDKLDNIVDVVHFADDGVWPRSTADAGPDGHGPSIELVHPGAENNHGSAWQASAGAGTPGAPNSALAPDPPPIIRSVVHAPAAPRPQDAVAVTARVSDEASVASVRLFSRLDGAPSFDSAAMSDDGAHGDGKAGDGIFGGGLIARSAGAIVQFYIEATDGAGHARRFPADAPARTCLYQVDDRVYPAALPLYRAVLPAASLAELTNRSLDSDVLLDGTFIHGNSVYYNIGIRYRGENSRNFAVKSFRIEFNQDRNFQGIIHLNLNAEDPHVAQLGMDFLRRSDIPAPIASPAAFTLNGNWMNRHGGLYERVEAIDDDYLARQFPGDSGGNLYRGLDPSGPELADLTYRGPDPAAYAGLYEKHSNREKNDYADLIALTDALTTTPDDLLPGVLDALLDAPEWIRYFAAETVINNQDGAISNTSGEDYYLYRRPSDGRWVIIPWDQNENFESPGQGIYRMALSTVRRFLLHPAYLRSYHRAILQMLDGPFSETVMARSIGAVEGVFSSGSLSSILQFVPSRQAAIRALIPELLTAGIDALYLARTGDAWRYFRGRREPSGGTTAWADAGFDDSGWEEGSGGFGFGDADDSTTFADMAGNYTTVYMRRAFELDNPAAIASLTLSIRYDDGFVLYINGVEAARRGITGTLRFDGVADQEHEADTPVSIDLTSQRGLLRTGRNVLAAAGVNFTAANADMTIDPQLFAAAQGSGCGSRLFARSASISLAGAAPLLHAAGVEVNGSEAGFNRLTGAWYFPITVPPGASTYRVIARDEAGGELAEASVEVLSGAGTTGVSGTLVGSTTWTEVNSPYIITGNLTVPAGANLTLQPGVIVFVDPGVSAIVRGALHASGTESRPIHLQASSCGGRWGGIAFLGASASGVFERCEITRASLASSGSSTYAAALALEDGASVRMENCHLAQFDGVAIDIDNSDSQLTMLDSLIEETGEAISGNGGYIRAERVHIRNLIGKSDCIDMNNESTPQSIVRNCILENSPDDGFDLDGASPLVDGNIVRGMACKGLSIGGVSSPVFSNNVIYDCNDGIVSKDGADPVLRHNTVAACSIGLHFFEKTAGRGGGRGAADSHIIWGNGMAVLLDPLSSVDLTFTDISGGYAGEGNRDFDPRFFDPASGDFRLRPGSPAIGAGRDGEDMGALPAGPPVNGAFIRGDANRDAAIDISDAVRMLVFLFKAGTEAPCRDALDADDSGSLDITDPIRLLLYLFQHGPVPAPPFPMAGVDPTPGDPLDCADD